MQVFGGAAVEPLFVEVNNRVVAGTVVRVRESRFFLRVSGANLLCSSQKYEVWNVCEHQNATAVTYGTYE